MDDAEEPTRRKVVASILKHGPSTAQQLADRLGLTAAGIRRHLTALTETGHLDEKESKTLLDRGRGRPSKTYVLSNQGRTSFFQAYDDLALQVLTFLRESGGDAAIEAFAENRANQVEEHCRQIMLAQPHLTPAEVLRQALEWSGHVPSTAPAGSGEQLCQHHCPVAHVAQQFPELCEAETRAFERVLGSHVQRIATIAHGDNVCTTHIPITPVVSRSTQSLPDPAPQTEVQHTIPSTNPTISSGTMHDSPAQKESHDTVHPG